MPVLLGKTGVVIATSGPGVGNLASGLMTASAENDPVLAIGGQVPRKDLYRLTHQSTPAAALFEPITNYSVEIQDPNNISEILSNAIALLNGPRVFRAALLLHCHKTLMMQLLMLRHCHK